jgi:ribulose-5-phosphate 4-epimerase/fuculose-1-phosphate aldolase
MLLRNHGTLSAGATAAEAWLGMFFLERACKQQTMALSIGRENVLLAPEAAQAEVRQVAGMAMPSTSALSWPGMLRRLDRELPGYDA